MRRRRSPGTTKPISRPRAFCRIANLPSRPNMCKVKRRTKVCSPRSRHASPMWSMHDTLDAAVRRQCLPWLDICRERFLRRGIRARCKHITEAGALNVLDPGFSCCGSSWLLPSRCTEHRTSRPPLPAYACLRAVDGMLCENWDVNLGTACHAHGTQRPKYLT